MTRKPSLDASTDQALAHLAAIRRKSPDPQIRATLPVADDLAALLAEQFPGDEEKTGRILMTAASALTALLQEFRTRPIPERSITAALLNTLGFAAETLCRDGEGT
jgi:hypothetical protein